MKKVLLVDPDKNVVEDLKYKLEEHKYTVISSLDGASAVQKALAETPDIILCDTETNGLNGFEVFNTLQQINSTAIIPFVFLTTNNAYPATRNVMSLGADDYLVKPIKDEELIQLVEIRLKKQEKLINLADEKFNTLMEKSFSGVFIYKDDRFSYVNKKFCEVLGYNRKELIGMNIVNIVYKDDIDQVITAISNCFKGLLKEIDLEFRAIRYDQELVKIRLTGSLTYIHKKKSIIGSITETSSADQPNFAFKKLPSSIRLTRREQEILALICEGLANSEIAEKLFISERTVEGHRSNLLMKTNCRNSVCLALFAVKYGLYKIT